MLKKEAKIPGTLVEELLVGSLRCRGRRRSNVRKASWQ